ncbi:aspartate aminotransferase family protein [Deinococcus sp. QL22]|uniref:aspartate aminotransferase family protein n=1 Tax=Deinococcus sp. QL22 TaxID=2939437 RepID=UPI0020175924|nr:aspartate aminotransferase family protein [Deinococcus sp. QL22]UQN08976.1 aspartate aminotransferase family protein [Deinococcus sp. QL22]
MTVLTNTQRWLDSEHRYDSGVFNKHPLVLVRGQNTTVWDAEGRAYLDCATGAGVASVGHCNPDVVRAIQQQAATLLTVAQTIPNDKRAEFLEVLTSLLPDPLHRVFLCSSGTEAMEAAKKFAVTATRRSKFIAMKRGFSGRSLGALAFTWEPAYREPFGAILDSANVEFIAYGDTEALQAALDDSVAAVILEPVQGEGGVRPADLTFMQVARDLTRQHGALLILDEIQTGFGRTGKMFAMEHFGIVPDGITLAKAMGGGIPIGAFVTTADVASRMPKGGHGGTFGGNPLAMAAGTAAMRFTAREHLPEQAAEKGAYFLQQLRAITSPKIREVRGLGLMIGVELKQKSAPIIAALEQDEGVLALPATSLVVRFLPPLTITHDEIDQVVTAFERVLQRS